MRRTLIVPGTLVLCSGLLFAQALFQKPVKVLGDPNFIGTASNPLAFDSIGPNWVEGKEMNGPTGVAVDNSVSPPILYIADTGNNRVLGFRYATQLLAGSVADVVIGQVDLYANQAQTPGSGRSTGLNRPTGLAVDSAGNLYVADTGNNRILKFPQPFAAGNANQFPVLEIGQKSLSTSTANLGGIGPSTLSISGSQGRTGLAFDTAGNLWVADTANNRVLRFPASQLTTGTIFPAADTVVGQSNFTSTTGATARTTVSALAAPNGVALDPAGNLYVTDQDFRVLEFTGPVGTGQSASRILGVDSTPTQSATTPSLIALNSPLGVIAPSSGPIVVDTGNNRLMLYSSTSQATTGQTSPAANSFIGQSSATVNQANMGNVDASASSFNNPQDIAASATEYYVADTSNNRVLVFSISNPGIAGGAIRVIGQPDFQYQGENLVDGKGFSFPGGFPVSAVLDRSVSPPRLYVADTLNNRVLGFKNFNALKNGQSADLVIGQPDFNRVVVNYPSGVAVTPSATGLNLPTGLTVDLAGNLYVSDTGNSRVLRFPAPYASGMTALEPADLVLGQQNFTTVITDATSVTLSEPAGIALTSAAAAVGSTSGFLAVADAAQNRVLLFSAPFTSGMSAVVVLGQSGFTTTATGSSAAGLNTPSGVAVDPQDRLLVADTDNLRVQIYDKPSNLTSGGQALVSLGGLSSPVSIGVGPSGDFWVADTNAGLLRHFPAVANLPLTNNSSDGSLSALKPHGAFVDAFNNLLVTDNLNRVLYFAPQINLTNAANYSTRALAAGTIAALFPAVTTNVIANGTATAPAGQFPLPTNLSDTQVTVGGTAAPLLFVSPGQNNVILPQSLATGGTADLQAVRVSTGQIYGGAEVQLASASPGLFTLNASGSAQVLAVNLQDSTVNSSSHPVTRGQYVILYGTGVGPVPSPPADGTPASGQAASDLPLVLIASAGTVTTSTGTTTLPAFVPATVTYSGLAPGFAGLWQINVQIPTTAASGSTVVIRVYEKDIPNLDQSSSLTTTLSVR